MILKINYDPFQKLSRITKMGPGFEVLNYSEFFEKLFSDDFIAVPDVADIKKFDSEKVIKWTTELKGAKPVDSITPSIKTKLASEKAKLVDKIKKLEGELASPVVEDRKEKEQELHIYKAFSFDWDSPDPKDIYMADNKLVILNWGLCDPEGFTIIISNGGDPGPPPEDEDEPQPEPTKTPWYYWLIVPLLLLILLLLKNCAPYAEITFNDSDSDILFESHKSHDHNNFFSSGILKETKDSDLERQWTVYQERNSIIDSSWIEMEKSDSDTIRTQKHGDGVFWIKLTIKDTGNKFGFWNKSVEDNILYVVRSDTIRHVQNFLKQDVGDDSSKFVFIDPVTGDPIDTDKDGTIDDKDDFPYDPLEQADEDTDGVGAHDDPDDYNPDIPFLRTDIPTLPPQDGTPPPQDGTPPPQDGTPPPQDGTPPPPTISVFNSEKKIITDYNNGWKEIKVMRRESENEKWRRFKIYYLDPNGVKKQKLPANLQKKKEKLSSESI
tara:strand:- start:676 stop:2160 length:1485 start_codon:yes stop_codon:yes gene_type:complete